MFRKGHKVARVSGYNNWPGIPMPAINETVHVCNSYVTPCGDEMIELLEYPTPKTTEYWPGFRAQNYRRVTDISDLKALCDPSPTEKFESIVYDLRTPALIG